jgi:hypothetical protein
VDPQPLLPVVNYQKYVRYLLGRIESFLSPPASSRREDRASLEWVAEQLLSLFSRTQGNLTPAKITDIIVGRWPAIQHELSPPRPNDLFHCRVHRVDSYAPTRNPVVVVSPVNSQQTFHLWPHPSLAQFVGTQLLGPNRRVRMVAGPLVNDSFMLPVRVVVIDLESHSHADVRWVKTHSHTLSRLRPNHVPDSLFVKVSGVSHHSISLIDDSHPEPVQLDLSDKDLGYGRLLRIGDLIVVWRAEQGDEQHLLFGPLTAIIRLPILDRDVSDPRDCQCRGIVTAVAHSTSGIEWTGCHLEIGRKKITFERDTSAD